MYKKLKSLKEWQLTLLVGFISFLAGAEVLFIAVVTSGGNFLGVVSILGYDIPRWVPLPVFGLITASLAVLFVLIAGSLLDWARRK